MPGALVTPAIGRVTSGRVRKYASQMPAHSTFLVEIHREERQVSTSHGQLVAADVTTQGWLCIVKGPRGYKLIGSECFFEIPVFVRYPDVRALPSGKILLVDQRTTRERENAWLLDLDGRVVSSFFAGDAIQDTLICNDFIVFTYFDEGALGGAPPSVEGVSMFSLEGDFVFGYKSSFAGQAVDVADCYAACWGPGQKLWFSPYTGFPLVGLNLYKQTQIVLRPPAALAGANALTTDGKTFVFHGPYAHKNELFAWQPTWRRPIKIGELQQPARSIMPMRLLSVSDTGYSITTIAAT